MGHKSETHSSNDQVPKQQYITRRKESGMWQFKMRIPDDVIKTGFYGSKTLIKKSLKTGDIKEAVAKRDELLNSLHDEFYEARKKLRPKLTTEAASFRLKLSELSVEEELKFVDEYFAELERIKLSERRDSFSGAVDQELVIIVSTELTMMLDEFKDGRTPLRRELFDRWAIEIDNQERFSRMCNDLRKADIESQYRYLDWLEGKPVTSHNERFSLPDKTVQVVSAGGVVSLNEAEKKNSLTLNDLCEVYDERWNSENTNTKTWSTKLRVLRIIRIILGGETLLSELSKTHGNEIIQKFMKLKFRVEIDEHSKESDILASTGKMIAKRTVKDKVIHAAAFFNFYADEYDSKSILTYKQINKLVKVPKGRARIPLEGEHLSKVMNSPYFSETYTKWKKKGKLPHAKYWVPFIAMFHGVRREEACQLQVADISLEGIVSMSISDTTDGDESSEDEKKSIKNDSSERVVPIHSQLIKMGFIEFVKQRKKNGDVRLFPELNRNKHGKLSGSVGSSWGRLVDSVQEIPAREVSGDYGIHSFRHGVVTQFRNLHIPADLQDSIGGWSDGSYKNSRGHYGVTCNIEEKKKAIDQIHFEGVDFSKFEY